MLRFSFPLRKEQMSKKTGLIPVSILVSYQGLKIRKKISGVNVLEHHWSKKQQRIIPNKKDEAYNHSSEYNLKLDELAARLNNLWIKYEHVLRKPLSEHIIIETIEGNIKVEKDKVVYTLRECFSDYIEQNRSHRAERTITGYNTVKNVLDLFLKESKYDDTLENINLHFFDQLRNYAFEVKKFENNYFSRIITNIKTVMKWADERGYHKNTAYTKFVAPEADIEVIYLSLSQLLKLYHHPFDKKQVHLAKSRDVFCFSAFTGLRYSSMKNLKRSNIRGNHLNFTEVKTKSQDQIIPLNNFALEILEKYQTNLKHPLPMISSQKLNDNIKKACELAEINDLITITRFSGSKRIEKTAPLWSLISLHSGRKTFITNSLVLGMNKEVIKNITGHKTDSSFRKYVKVSDDFKSSQMDQFWNQIELKEQTKTDNGGTEK